MVNNLMSEKGLKAYMLLIKTNSREEKAHHVQLCFTMWANLGRLKVEDTFPHVLISVLSGKHTSLCLPEVVYTTLVSAGCV